MSESSPDTAPAAAAGMRAPPIVVVAQYLKDLSFESPGAPAAILETRDQPQGSVQVDVRARSMGDLGFEVTLALRVEAVQGAPGTGRDGSQIVYLLELEYAGVFRIGAVPAEMIEPLIMVEAPRLLFPFARQVVANATREGGFPPLTINPVDFAALYRDHRRARQSGQAAPAEAAG